MDALPEVPETRTTSVRRTDAKTKPEARTQAQKSRNLSVSKRSRDTIDSPVNQQRTNRSKMSTFEPVVRMPPIPSRMIAHTHTHTTWRILSDIGTEQHRLMDIHRLSSTARATFSAAWPPLSPSSF